MDWTVKAGKLSPQKLRGLVFDRLHQRRCDILLRPGLGEDSAVIDFGDEVCVISTDPITGASQRLGWLAVHVSCNDVAANGAEPVGIQTALLLPEGTSDEFIGRLMADMDAACGELGIEILGGHTKVTSQVSAPLIVTTALGRAPRDRYVTSQDARPEDVIYVTKVLGPRVPYSSRGSPLGAGGTGRAGSVGAGHQISRSDQCSTRGFGGSPGRSLINARHYRRRLLWSPLGSVVG